MTKLAIIGAGQWATPYALAAKHTGAEISGIYTPDNTASDLASKVNTRPAENLQDLISGADCIILGSPTHTHVEHIKTLADSGKPVLCASPIAASSEDLDKIQQTAGNSSNIYASFPLRSRPEYQRLKAAIADGELGQLGVIRLGKCLPQQQGWRADTTKSGGILLETGVHLIDVLSWLAGPVTRVYGASPESDLQYSVLVARLQDGSIAHLEVSWAEADGVAFDYYEVSGRNGLLEFDTRNAPLMRVEERSSGTNETVRPGATVAEHELRQFLAAASNGSKGDLATLAEGIEACRRVLQVQEAVKSDQVLSLA